MMEGRTDPPLLQCFAEFVVGGAEAERPHPAGRQQSGYDASSSSYRIGIDSKKVRILCGDVEASLVVVVADDLGVGAAHRCNPDIQFSLDMYLSKLKQKAGYAPSNLSEWRYQTIKLPPTECGQSGVSSHDRQNRGAPAGLQCCVYTLRLHNQSNKEVCAIPIFILDLVRIREGSDARVALDNARDLGRHAEGW